MGRGSGTIALDGESLTRKYADAPRDGFTYTSLAGAMRGGAVHLKERVTATTGLTYWVQAAVVIWGHFPEGEAERDNVAYVSGDQLEAWLSRQPVRLSPRDQQLIRLGLDAEVVVPRAYAAYCGRRRREPMGLARTDRPRSNAGPEEVARKLALLDASHIAPLTALVRRLRAARDGDVSIPWFDPTEAGTDARILMLFEAPGRRATAGQGSGFISADNNDGTAENMWRLLREAGVDRSRRCRRGPSATRASEQSASPTPFRDASCAPR